jgi:beta-phosphoglucomutase-like phosphatase (HAD superfamily)
MAPIRDEDVKGMVFDCDGTLVDTMPAYFRSWTQLCEIYGLTLEENKFYSLAGVPVKDIIAMLINEAGKQDELTVEEVFKTKCGLGEAAVKEVGTPVIECVVEIARKFHGKIPLAVASSGNRQHVMASLTDNNILHLFDAVVTCEEVSNPKPAPDIFLLAAAKIGVDPTKCRGFEDADLGMQSVTAAGMEAVDVRLMDQYPRRK